MIIDNVILKYIGSVVVGLLTLNSCSFDSFFNEDFKKNGINNYRQTLSDVSLCSYLTFHYEDRYQNIDPLVQTIIFKNSYFSYNRKIQNNLQIEKAFMRLDYDNLWYLHALKYISDQPGYLVEVLCEYKSYEFHLNNTLQLFYDEIYAPYYNFEVDNSFIHWINIVGINEDNYSIVLIGFYYNIFSKNALNQYYSFSNWESLFDTYFNVDSWDKDIIIQ